MLRRISIPALLLLAGLGACREEPQTAAAQVPGLAEPQGQAQTGLRVIPLTISSGTRRHVFQVEVAASESEQSRGMMFRRWIAPDAGMLFPFVPPRPASFWMKNTLIPLDMLFIRQDGSIARIAAKATPLSLDAVGVGEPVAAVLELAGGRAAALGIQEGDRASWSDGPAR